MHVAVIGVGATGARAARQLAASDEVDRLVLADADPEVAETAGRTIGERVEAVDCAEAITRSEINVLAVPGRHQPALAVEAIRAGGDVICLADGLDDVRSLLDVDAEARERGRTVIVSAGFAPGLTCVLARHAAAWLDTVRGDPRCQAGNGRPFVRPRAPRRAGPPYLGLAGGRLAGEAGWIGS